MGRVWERLGGEGGLGVVRSGLLLFTQREGDGLVWIHVTGGGSPLNQSFIREGGKGRPEAGEETVWKDAG